MYDKLDIYCDTMSSVCRIDIIESGEDSGKGSGNRIKNGS
jgi:hypothetical protein